LNALNHQLMNEVMEALETFDKAEGIGATVITGSEKAFAAGADIKEMAELKPTEVMQHGIFKVWSAVAACPRPIIAAVNGFALGGGCELAMACDIIIAGESARFGQPEVKIGIIPGGGGTQRLPRAAGKYKAMRYLLTGDLFGAREASDMGLVSEVVPDAEVEKRALDMASRIAALPPLAVGLIKEAVLQGLDASLEAGLTLETKGIQLLFASEDQKEGMAAFIEKRQPKFTGR
jgi:enoyl-CoA hydratase/carnithine racemase